jgi:outer membrane lipoprotein SlyB
MTTASATTTAASAFTLPRRGAWIGAATALVAVGAMATALSLKQPVASPVAAEAVAPRPAPAAARLPAQAAALPPALAQADTQPPAPAAAPREAAPACNGCGTVTAVKAVRQKGQASGAGAAIGGVLGGVLGNQMGKGNGRTAMTVIGAVGGGVAGHEIEKRRKATTVYQVTVRLDDGSSRTVTRQESWALGRRVQLDGQGLRALRGTPAGKGGAGKASSQA